MPGKQQPANFSAEVTEAVNTDDPGHEPVHRFNENPETSRQDSESRMVQGIRAWAKSFQEYASKVDL
jgi:hypothetical protein